MVNYPNNPTVGQRFTLPSGVVMECAVAGVTPVWKALPNIIEGIDGKSAYEIALDNGFIGTESEWLLSLKGEQGAEGDSAYQVAIANGFMGTEAQWLESLVGEQGPSGSVTDQHNLLEGRDLADAHPASSISGLATVATSGQFTDLTGADSIQQQINSARILALAGL